MKIQNIIIALILICITYIAHAGVIVITVKNEYSKQIAISTSSTSSYPKVDYIPAKTSTKTSSINLGFKTPEELAQIVPTVGIKAQGAWHKGISEGFYKAHFAAKNNPNKNVHEVITILDTPTYQTNFKYHFAEPQLSDMQQPTKSPAAPNYEEALRKLGESNSQSDQNKIDTIISLLLEAIETRNYYGEEYKKALLLIKKEPKRYDSLKYAIRSHVLADERGEMRSRDGQKITSATLKALIQKSIGLAATNAWNKDNNTSYDIFTQKK